MLLSEKSPDLVQELCCEGDAEFGGSDSDAALPEAALAVEGLHSLKARLKTPRRVNRSVPASLHLHGCPAWPLIPILTAHQTRSSLSQEMENMPIESLQEWSSQRWQDRVVEFMSSSFHCIAVALQCTGSTAHLGAF